MEVMQPTPNRIQAAPRRRQARTRAACTIALALGLAGWAYWRADPAAVAREAYRACAGEAASALHAPNVERRAQALQTLTDCAAQR